MGRVYQWPAWNVADAGIVVGTILLAILLLRDDRRNAQETVNVSKPGASGTGNTSPVHSGDE